MFFGEYDHSLDQKNRLILPSKFREVLLKQEHTQKLFLTRGFDSCLALYMENDWFSELKKLKSKPYQKKEVRAFHRLLLSKTIEIVCDKQGRILIPDKFKQGVGIEKEIVFIGLWNKIEIWDKNKWNQFNNDNTDNFEKIAEDLFDNVDSFEE